MSVQSLPSESLLRELFELVNQFHFDSFLDYPVLKWNSRLRTSAGRFIPGSRKFWKSYPPIIEVASYLFEEENSRKLIQDTIAHEMIHYWLWLRKKPYGHSGEFKTKMVAMGVSRYNPVPRLRPYRYLYKCTFCSKEFPARKRLGPLACANCCKQYSRGNYDRRYRLILDKVLITDAKAKRDESSQAKGF